jgi:DNA polymerase III subunit beta
MKITAEAGMLAEALALAEPALTAIDPQAKKITALSTIHVQAADGIMMLTSNILDFSITVKAAIEVVEPGEVAVSLRALSTLIAGFPKDATLTISADKVMTVTNDKGRFRLQTIPLGDMPARLELEEEASVELGAADLLRLIAMAFVASRETTRYYLNGVFLHSVDGDLVAVGTDGHRLMRTSIPAGTFSTDCSCIVPLKATTAIQKILRKTKPEKVTLRRSKALLMVETPSITFVTKLINAEYPDYRRIIPQASANAITCNSDTLVAALRRLAAVAAEDKPLIALQWQHGQGLELFLARQPDDGHDVVAAETAGNGRVAAQLSLLAELLEEIAGDTISLSTDSAHAPIVVRLVGDERLLALLMPCAHNFAIHKTAA